MGSSVAEAFRESVASPEAPADLEFKISQTGILDATDDGLITAIVAVTGIVDEVDDIILPGAFADTLSRRIPKGVWSHDMNTWVARTEAIFEALPGDARLPAEMKGKPWPADAGALIVKTRFNLGTRDGADAYSNVKFFDEGPLGPQVEWSIGYHVPQGKSRRNRVGQRLIAALETYEYSPVLFGAMPLCGNLATKQRTDYVETKVATVGGLLEGKAAGSMGKATTHEPVGKGPLWKHKGWQLPAYIQHVANDLKESGKDESRAIAMAIGIIKNWAHGHDGKGNKIKASTQAAAEKALAEWTALKAKAAASRAAKAGTKEAHVTLETTGPDALTAVGEPGTAEWEASASADDVAAWLQSVTDDGGDPPELQPEDEQIDEATPDGVEPADEQPPAADTDVEISDDEMARLLAEVDELDGELVEVKASKAAGDVASGDEVTLSSKGETVTGKVSGTKKRGKVVGLTVDGKTVWVPVTKNVEVKALTVAVPDPLEIEIKEALLAVAEGKDYPYIPGSVEERQSELRDAVNDLLMPEPDDKGNRNAYVSLDATFADYVLATLADYSGGDTERHCYVIPYTIDDSDNVALGAPTPVKQVVSIVPDDVPDDADDAEPVAPGGMNPNLPIARKLAVGTKALLDHLEAKAASGAPVVGAHARELRAAHEGLVNAMIGLGLPTSDVELEEPTVELKALSGLELALLDADIAMI